MNESRNQENPFYINDNRVMISLGSLTDRTYCPYNCAFCYVKAGFMKYARLSIDYIISYLKQNIDKYNIIYISGDTDSFAPPRTKRALELLYEISRNIDRDILFTTRTVFSVEDLLVIKEINKYMRKKNRKLYACISISRLHSHHYIEPHPIPHPEERISTLKHLNELGIYTILATRPFLPIISADEYIEIIRKSKDYINAVIGEVWYATDELIENVFRDTDISNVKFVEKKMDFDDNNIIWKCYEAENTKIKVEKYCKDNKIGFFMRSKDAIEYISNSKNDKY